MNHSVRMPLARPRTSGGVLKPRGSGSVSRSPRRILFADETEKHMLEHERAHNLHECILASQQAAQLLAAIASDAAPAVVEVAAVKVARRPTPFISVQPRNQLHPRYSAQQHQRSSASQVASFFSNQPAVSTTRCIDTRCPIGDESRHTHFRPRRPVADKVTVLPGRVPRDRQLVEAGIDAADAMK